MVTVRDVDKILSLMRRVYDVVVIDTPVGLDDATLALLDACDTIIEIVTFDSTTIHNTLAMADTFRSHRLRRRRRSATSSTGPIRAGGIDVERAGRGDRPGPGALRRVRRAAGHPVEQRGRAVRPGRARGPDQPRHHSGRRAARRRSDRPGRGAALGRDRSATDRRLRLRRRRADGPPRDRPPAARRIDDLPRRQRPRAVRAAARRRGPGVQPRRPSTGWPSATSRRS